MILLSCYNPNAIEYILDRATGAVNSRFIGAVKYDDPRTFGTPDDLSTVGHYTKIVPCGHCIGCNIDYSREWANRMIIELQYNPDAIFLTLTYNDDHLPRTEYGDATLCKRDLQLFWKRLRKAFPGRKIRYYVAGEYGSTTFRPHYHAIVYGLSLNDFCDLSYRGCNELRDPFYSSEQLAHIWSNGFILMSTVTHRTCAYVARYVLKKYGDHSPRCAELGIEPEFNLSSRRPGIGLKYADTMVLSGNNTFALDGRDGIHDVTLPKSFISYCKRHNICLDKINDICYSRAMDAHNRLISNLEFSEKSFYEFLRSKEARLSGRIDLLPERKEV